MLSPVLDSVVLDLADAVVQACVVVGSECVEEVWTATKAVVVAFRWCKCLAGGSEVVAE